MIKRPFGYTKVKYLNLTKNKVRLTTSFSLSNLWVVRKRLFFRHWVSAMTVRDNGQWAVNGAANAQ